MARVKLVSRRLFFALWPDPATRDALVRLTGDAVQKVGGRPIAAANLHLTLAFLGNQPAASYAQIVAAAAKVTPAKLRLTLDRFGYWPHLRIFMLAPASCPDSLRKLADNLTRAMTPLVGPTASVSYQPHVTLARKVAALPEVESPRPLIWNTSEFSLIESSVDHHGAQYTVLDQFRGGSRSDPNLA